MDKDGETMQQDADAQERQYFARVMQRIAAYLQQEVQAYDNAQQELRTYLYSSWEDGTHMGASIDRLIEAVQIGRFARTQELLADKRMDRIRALRALADSAYFARVDFTEEGDTKAEQIYIGRHALYDEGDRTPLVYDWRAPISSIFYRFEKGPVFYEAPMGTVRGNVSLKRQYEIRNGKLEYFFDADVQISDEFLRRMLSKNASSRMKTIVETIQKEQDVVIRDADSELLIVQGVAGSGKTSIALHRVAYLMYEGLQNRLQASDIVILSPNTLFESYISGVLPELGEHNSMTLEFEQIARRITQGYCGGIHTRNEDLEAMFSNGDDAVREAMRRDMRFKMSSGFAAMICRYKERCVQMLPLADIRIGDRVVAAADDMRALLTRKQDRNCFQSRLERLRAMVLDALRDAQSSRIEELETAYAGQTDEPAEDAARARAASLREAAHNRRQLMRMTQPDYQGMYRRLVTDPALLTALCGGKHIRDLEKMCDYSREHLDFKNMSYADAMAFSWFMLQFIRADFYRGVKQVVVDEAQDYAPMQYRILKTLFARARYTVLGDVNQSIGKEEDESVYDMIERILARKKSLRITMRKSFRCTNQIIAFSSQFIDARFGLESFNRDGAPVTMCGYADADQMLAALPQQVQALYDAGCGNVAVITKTAAQAAAVYAGAQMDAQLVVRDKDYELTGTLVLPIYMAKGLEFDGVVIFDASDAVYARPDERRLLYVASTRALHMLTVVYAGMPSRFLKTEAEHV